MQASVGMLILTDKLEVPLRETECLQGDRNAKRIASQSLRCQASGQARGVKGFTDLLVGQSGRMGHLVQKDGQHRRRGGAPNERTR